METLSGVELDVGGDPEPSPGFEVVVSSAHLGRAEGRSRAEFLAELVALRRSIVVGGAHGKTTTAAMIAYVLRELGHDPGLDHRRRRASARRQRRRWGGLARRRGRRVRPLDRAPASRDRRGDEHRARPPRRVRLGDGARVVLRGVARRSAERRARLGAGARGVRARGAGRAQSDERRRRARRARAGRRVAIRRRARARALRGRRAGGSSWLQTVEAFASTTTTRTIPTEIEVTLRDRAGANRGAAHRRLPAPCLRAHAPALPGARRRARARGRGRRDGRDRRARRASSRESAGSSCWTACRRVSGAAGRRRWTTRLD